ncbi:hypothetical protein BD410DRAFT_835114 [Rickenella mellea]|uniref:Septin-type G domain-containing protein n=1 Tax=Rickenella mellea TaxID=50990 RepID=A0A4Y7QJJ9_9AGAM|nr:hypothetical protein BD410DRAFT_835114 [Rickenella mellea]
MSFSPSTSAQTIRHNTHSTHTHPLTPHTHPSPPSSPLSNAQQAPLSPPDSPSDSLSSFPSGSVSSSFFFSSNAASPQPHWHHRRSNRSRPISDYDYSDEPSDPENEHGHDRRRDPAGNLSLSLNLNMSSAAEGLIIPSLTLPPALQQPTPYGQTMGDVRLLVLGPKHVGKTAIANYLVDGNVDVVDVDPWDEEDGCKVLRASTDWLEGADDHDDHEEMHGHEYERFEGSRNFTLLELPGFDDSDSINDIITPVLALIHKSYHDLNDLLNTTTSPSTYSSKSQPSSQPSLTALHTLLASSSTNSLPTALLFIASTPPTKKEVEIVERLAVHVPVISLPPISRSSASSSSPPAPAPPSPPSTAKLTFSSSSNPNPNANSNSNPIGNSNGTQPQRGAQTPFAPPLSSFRPTSAFALRTGLFRSPKTLKALRREGADRFVRWVEVAGAVALAAKGEGKETGYDMRDQESGGMHWSKAEWESTLSQDVARAFKSAPHSTFDYTSTSTCHAIPLALDPLHIPSLLALSVSSLLVAPLRGLLLTSRPHAKGSSYHRHRTESESDSNAGDSKVEGKTGVREGKGQGRWRWRVLIMGVGVFCAGVGIGYVLSGSA